MKAEELMVGDWVRVKDCIDQFYYFDEYEPGEIVQVREILDNGINPNWAGAEVSGILGLEDIQPIPITPEILEKNGFENDFYEDVSVADYHSIRVEGYSLRGKVDDWDDYLVSYCNGSVCVVTDFHGEVKKEMCYVHELQHCLKLCGIDKTIEL